MTTLKMDMDMPINGNGMQRKGRTPVPENEAREDKFVRLALKRMGALKSKVRQIGNLASYPHTDEQATKIIAEMKRMAAYIEEAFTAEPATDEFNF